MAVTYVKEKDNTLGALGTLATLAGMATGAGWLTPLGMGLNAMNASMNGKDQLAQDTALDIIKGLKEGRWKNSASGNPASGNIAKVADKVKKVAGKVSNISPSWAGYGNGTTPFGTLPNGYPSVNPSMYDWGI